MDHAVPFQCSISVWPKEYWPAAQQFDAEVHVTSRSWLSWVALVLGELTMDHAVPFQCSMNVWPRSPWPWEPTAQQSEAEVHVTPLRPFHPMALGEVTMDHAVPFQCSMSVWPTLPL